MPQQARWDEIKVVARANIGDKIWGEKSLILLVEEHQKEVKKNIGMVIFLGYRLPILIMTYGLYLHQLNILQNSDYPKVVQNYLKEVI
ncbi:Type I restriction-modification system methyltransferase subunit [Actinobacillus minor 202]|uniref:Type I restriction-modification system methyltransferase subunit n=1 Tax=Actinobacillus minor 202 TaxID=591023 RepID=A0ABP2GR54_9PAST|nr:Type I restriction-modification system methyltransferase subunit [Actinobacillus minor 202]